MTPPSRHLFTWGTLALLVLGVIAWRLELIAVERSGAQPEPLRAFEPAARPPARFDATLPLVPAGAVHVAPGGDVLIVHYWAPWERHSGPQALALDSLRRTLPGGGIALAVVCFDPYPSVTRYAAKLKLRLPLLLDLRRDLAAGLPCPGIPYTYVIDRSGRIAVAQGGEVDWLSPDTRASLARLAAEPAPADSADARRRAS